MWSHLKSEWHAFKDAEPGARFVAQYERTRANSKGWLVVRALLGAILVIAGLVMLVIPGPGLLAIAFGFGLLASVSRTVAAALDRAEPPLHRAWRWLGRTWRALPRAAHIALVTAGAALAGGAGYVAWTWVAE